MFVVVGKTTEIFGVTTSLRQHIHSLPHFMAIYPTLPLHASPLLRLLRRPPNLSPRQPQLPHLPNHPPSRRRQLGQRIQLEPLTGLLLHLRSPHGIHLSARRTTMSPSPLACYDYSASCTGGERISCRGRS